MRATTGTLRWQDGGYVYAMLVDYEPSVVWPLSQDDLDFGWTAIDASDLSA